MSNDRLSITTINTEGQTESREVFCSYGLLNALVRVIGDPSRAASLELDPDLALEVLTLVLIPRSPTGKPLVPVDQFELPGLDVAEAYKIFDWVKGSVLNFFTARLGSTLTSITDRKIELAKLGSSLDGLKV